MKRLKASERRASILAVAKVLFADKGLHGVSVDEIARRLGVSAAVLYQHFESKEALYEAVLNEIAGTREDYVDAVVASSGAFDDVLRRMVQVFTESVAADPDYLRMEMWAALENNPAASQFFENRWKSFTDYIEFTLHELHAQGEARHINPRIASLMFQGMIREALYAKCIYNSPHYGDMSLNTLVDNLVKQFLAALELG